jgi:Flp pilus assembly protein TadG
MKPARDIQARDSRRGAAAVEFALLMPVFLLVVWGIVEFGRAMMVGQLVTNAARHGAREAILDGSTNSAVEAEVDSFLVNSIGSAVAASDVTVTYNVVRDGSSIGSDLASAEPKDMLTVIVQIDHSKVKLLPVKWLNGVKLTGRCTMRHE